MIVLNEYEWAERAIAAHELGKKPYETLSRVAKYYYENGYSKREIRQMLDSFLLQCDATASLQKWSGTLDAAVKSIGKLDLVCMDSIDVTKGELSKIKELGGKQIQRLAFTLLCVAKYKDATREKNDHWVNLDDKEISAMANINTTIRRQSAMYTAMRDAGMIQFSKRIDNLSARVLFIQDGEVVMRITDFRNLGYQYLKYYGDAYFECQNCGLVVRSNQKATGRPQKYCPACAIEVKTRQTINSIMKSRANKKESA